MKKVAVQYPWRRLEKGQGFFVPCLDTERVKEEGLIAAVSTRTFDAKAKIGTINGRLGVLFFRVRPPSVLQNQP
jgi:hypothetical protein